MYNPIPNKYYKWYNSICIKAKERGWTKKLSPQYVERHHIIPKSLGGDNSKDNLICLTSKEHYICHLLLTKFCIKEEKYKMTYALHMMLKMHNKKHDRYHLTLKQYENLRINLFFPKSEEHKKKISESNKGKKHSFQRRQLRSLQERGKHKGELNHFYGKKHSEESILKIKEARSKQIITNETKEKMSLAHFKRYENNPKLKEEFSQNSIGSKNPAALKIVLKSPKNEFFILEGNFQKFITENHISNKAIHKTFQNNIPIQKGKNKGWIMISKEKN